MKYNNSVNSFQRYKIVIFPSEKFQNYCFKWTEFLRILNSYPVDWSHKNFQEPFPFR